MKISIENKIFLNKALSNKEFVKFLRKHKCFAKYEYYTLHSDIGHDEWGYNIFDSISNAFMWSLTNEGAPYWEKLDNLWENSIKITCKLRKNNIDK